MDLVLYVFLEFSKSRFCCCCCYYSLSVGFLKRERERKIVESGGWVGGEDLGETEIERKPCLEYIMRNFFL